MEKNENIQALRGILCLIVILSHIIGTIPINFGADKTFLHVFWDGNLAVFGFFIISGFFIANKTTKGMRTENLRYYRCFLLNRIKRLYPIYIFTLALSFVICNSMYNIKGYNFSLWFNSFWNGKVSFIELLKQCTMIMDFNSDLLNPPIWTLKHEIRAALILPLFIAILNNRKSKIHISLIILTSIIISKRIYAYNMFYHFVFGAVTFIIIDDIKKYVNYKRYAKYSILFLGIFMYSSRWLFLKQTNLEWIFGKDIIASVGFTLIFISIILFKHSIKILCNSIFLLIGNKSYTIYLSHFMTLLIMRNVFYLYNNYVIFYITIIPMIFLVAEIIERIFNMFLQILRMWNFKLNGL